MGNLAHSSLLVRLVFIVGMISGWVVNLPIRQPELTALADEAERGGFQDEAEVIQNLIADSTQDDKFLDPGAEEFREDLLKIEHARSEGLDTLISLSSELNGDALGVVKAEILSIQGLRSNRVGNNTIPPQVGADPRVGINGGGCTYYSIQDAVDAASITGDSIQVSAGIYYENVDITGKDLVISGDYDVTCTVTGGGITTVDGSLASESVFDIVDSDVVLAYLEVTGSSGTSFGGGIDLFANSHATLDNTDVHGNSANLGGGAYLDPGAVMTVTNDSDIYLNTATLFGGAGRIWGTFNGIENFSDIYQNSAPYGGGFSVPGGTIYLYQSDMYQNEATDPVGRGGAIHALSNATITLGLNTYIIFLNEAYDGGGIYADQSNVNLTSSGVVFRQNIANHHGGGLYLSNNSTLVSNGARIGQVGGGLANEALEGAGMYVITSTVDFSGEIFHNIAKNCGGGIYADNSTLNLTDAFVGGRDPYQPNMISDGDGIGAGMYLTGGTQATIENTVISSNSFFNTTLAIGGGIHIEDSSAVTLTNSTVELNTSPATATDFSKGAGIYALDGVVTLDNSQVVSNTAETNGGGIRLSGPVTLNILNGSVIQNNHAVTADGGGIAAALDPDINISNSTLMSNTAKTDGGAISLDSGTLDVTGWWDIRWNSAEGNGGGVAITGTADADFAVTDDSHQSYLAVNQADWYGGGVYLGNSDTVELHSPTGYQLNFNTNLAVNHGGAGYADSGGAFDVAGRVQMGSNSAGAKGGAFFLSGGSSLLLNPQGAYAPEFWVNNAEMGGAVFAEDNAQIMCNGSIFGASMDGNHALNGDGGAIYLEKSSYQGTNCIFRNNQALGHGGGIAAYESNVSIAADYTNCDPLGNMCSSFYGNTADQDVDKIGNGGAIYSYDSYLVIDQTYFHHNIAYIGGGLYQVGTGTASGEVNNSLFYANEITGEGGAAIEIAEDSFSLIHATLADNIGEYAFIFDGSGDNDVFNTIIWGNTNEGFKGTLTNSDCNIDQSGNSGTNIDPQFVSPGTSADYHLRSGSPAIDACVSGLTVDLDNWPRPALTNYDMGAFEYLPKIYLPVILK